MTPRKTAAAAGLTTYRTWKHCKNGHLAERYTSSGACVECLKGAAQDLKIKTRDARIAHNTAMVQGLQPYPVFVKPEHKLAVSEYCDILRYSSPEVIEQCRAFITMMKNLK